MSEKLKKLKKQIKSGTYDWEKAVYNTAERIIDYPQALLWK